MEKVIVYTDTNGNCCVVHPAYHDKLLPKKETEKELLSRVIAKAVPSDALYTIIDATEVSTDRTFRNAWEWNEGIKVNMPRARNIHMDNIRRIRNAELVKLDVSFIRASESKDVAEQERIAGLKQVLRDIPQTFDLTIATTPEELKLLFPIELRASLEALRVK